MYLIKSTNLVNVATQEKSVFAGNRSADKTCKTRIIMITSL